MGLLDWLTDGLGGNTTGSVSPFITATNNYNGPGGLPDGSMAPTPPTPQPDAAPPLPMSPPQMMQADRLSTAPIDPSTTDLGGGLPPGGTGAPALPPPINVGAPPGGNGTAPVPLAPNGGDLPPNATPTQGDGISLPGMMDSYAKAGGKFGYPLDGAGGTGQPQTMIGRALGLNGNTERQLRGSLAAGLKAAGNSAGKSPFQAFTSGAGEAMDGGTKADDKTTADQQKYLQRAIEAKRVGNAADYQTNYLKYQIESSKAKLAAATSKAAGKDSVMNSNEQLYLRGLSAAGQDPKVKLSAENIKNLQKTMDPASPELKAAIAAHEKLVDDTKAGIFKTLGVNEKAAATIGKQPGFSSKNPVPKEGLTQQKFDALPDGAYFINPKDGRLLIKRGAAAPAAGGAGVPAALSPSAPLPPPNLPMNYPGTTPAETDE